MLSTLGISEFDEQVYRAYVAEPDRTAREIAEHVGTTPGRIRHAVARLTEPGVLRREHQGRFRPVSPRTALSALLAGRRADAEAAFTVVWDAVDDLAREYRAGRLKEDPTELVEVITGEAAVTGAAVAQAASVPSDRDAKHLVDLAEYERHFKDHRPHQGRSLRPPLHDPSKVIDMAGRIRRRTAVNGLISEYHRAA